MAQYPLVPPDNGVKFRQCEVEQRVTDSDSYKECETAHCRCHLCVKTYKNGTKYVTTVSYTAAVHWVALQPSLIIQMSGSYILLP